MVRILSKKYKYFAFYKPFQVLCQFSESLGKVTLSSFSFPNNVYPVGRLDYDSEGLLVLTDDKQLTDKLLNPKNSHSRKYLVQVENVPSQADLDKLCKGVEINIDGNAYRTKKAIAKLINEPKLPPRVPPIRFRANIPTSWISLELKEGKNRQVRKMTASIGFPTLRLVRYSIESLSIEGFKSGEIREIHHDDIFG